jgi:putative oxidoreductase
MSVLDFTLLIVRVVLGITFIIHGGQKLFGWFGGPGIQKFSQGMSRFGGAHTTLMGWMAALSEFGGAVLLLIGLLTPLAAAFVISTMLVATVSVHLKNGFLSSKGGYEYNISLITLLLILLLLGAGAISFDHLLGFAVPISQLPVWTVIVFVLVIAGGLVVTELSRRSAKHAG